LGKPGQPSEDEECASKKEKELGRVFKGAMGTTKKKKARRKWPNTDGARF